MKKRIVRLLLCAVLVCTLSVCLLSGTVFAAAPRLSIGSSGAGDLPLIDDGAVTSNTTDHVSVSYDAGTNTATLTLSGANIDKTCFLGDGAAGIDANGLSRLNIILAPGTTNTIDVGFQGASGNRILYGFHCYGTDITVSGSGTLNLKVNTYNSDSSQYGTPSQTFGVYANSLTVEGNATFNIITASKTSGVHHAVDCPTTVNSGTLSVDAYDWSPGGGLQCFSNTITLNGGSVIQKAATHINGSDTHVAEAIAAVSGSGLTSTTANGITTYSLPHQWVFAAEDNVIRAWCTHPTSTGCKYHGERNAITLTLTADDAPYHIEIQSFEISGYPTEYTEEFPYAAQLNNGISGVTGADVSDILYRDANGNVVDSPTRPGDYTASVTLSAGTQKYTAEDAFTITKIPLTCTAPQARSPEWSGAAQELVTAGIVRDIWGLQRAGVIEYRLSPEAEWSTAIPTATEIGTYQVYWRAIPTGEYDARYIAKEPAQPITVTISPKTMTDVAAEGYTGTYDGNAHSITVTAADTATVSYKGPDAADYSAVNPMFTDAGEYEVAYKVEQVGCTTVTGTKTVVIEKCPVTVAGITVTDRDYDATDIANLDYSGVSFAGKLPQDTLTVSATGTYDNKNAGSNKVVSISNLLLGGADVRNYVLADSGNQTEASGQITPRNTSVIITPNGGTYRGTITPAAAELIGAADSEVPEVTLTYSGTALDGTLYTNSIDAPDRAGTFTVKASLADTNYVLTGSTEADFTVAKAVIPAPSPVSLPYNGEVQTGNVPYSADYEVFTNEGGTDVGSYPMVLQLLDANNYCWDQSSDAFVTLQFTIVQAENSWVTAPSITGWTYGSAANAPISAAKFGTAAVEYRSADGTDADYSAVVPTQAGDYLVRFSVPATENYAAITQIKPLTIAAKTAAIQWSGETALVYTGAEQCPTATVTDLVGEDVCTAVITGGATNAGSYTAAVTGLSNPNYQLPTEGLTQSFIIGKKAATVTAKNLRLHLGTKLPETAVLNEHYTLTGVVEGDSIGTISVIYQKDGQTVVPNRNETGTYDIVPVVTEANANYDISCISGKLTYYYTPPTPTYTPSVEDSSGGKTAVSDNYPSKGDKVTITVSPDKGYQVDSITVTDSAGREVNVIDNGDGTYTYVQPTGKVRIVVNYVPAAADFTDVAQTSYYYDAVNWAVAEEITNGISDTAFGPNSACTRAQAVTFLWRAAGSPEPKRTDCAFADVDADSYYYKAVLWAVEQGITLGTSDTTFSPDATITRGQAVAFLWRAEHSLEMDGEHGFRDVHEMNYYHDAVIWAVQNAITNGTSETTFSPDDACIRAQIVTFLYRTMAE